jgi:hypothetical protein
VDERRGERKDWRREKEGSLLRGFKLQSGLFDSSFLRSEGERRHL